MPKAKAKAIDMSSIFGEIDKQEEEAKVKTQGSSDPRILKFDKTKTVYFRLFPDLSNDKRPMRSLNYGVFNWESFSSGRSIYGGIDTRQFDGKPHFFETKRNELFNTKNDDMKKKAIALFPNEKALVNIFVISDSAEEENDGKDMIMRYGAKPVREAAPNSGSPFIKFMAEILSDPENDIGSEELFSLSEDGVTIKVVFTAGSDGNFPTYKYSYYQKPIKGFAGIGKNVNSPECFEAYKTRPADLRSVIEEQIERESDKFTPKFLADLFNSEILCVSTRDSSEASNLSTQDLGLDSSDDEDDEDDVIPMGDAPTKSKDEDLDLDFDLDDINLDED